MTMTTRDDMTVYLDGQLVPAGHARISPFDRGFLFGDGIYEGLRAFDGHVFAMDRHVERMREGLGGIGLDFDPSELARATPPLLEINATPNAFVYWQVTRGTPGPTDPVRSRLPTPDTRPTALAYCVPTPGLESFDEVPTIHAATVPDARWLRGRLKSTSLLGNVLAAREARERHGASEAIMIREGLVSEACACNVVLAVPDDAGRSTRLVTPSLESVPILAGVTRAVLLERMDDLSGEPVPAALLDRASEVILLGTMAMVTSVTRLDAREIGGGAPGPHARRLLDELRRAIEEDGSSHAARPASRASA